MKLKNKFTFLLFYSIHRFTADHCDLVGDHGKMNKGRSFRTSAGVPFIMRFPGKVNESKRIDSARSSDDFALTILSLVGVDNVALNSMEVTFQKRF